MAAGILVALALGLGTLALTSFFSGALLGSRGQSARTDAEVTAEAGLNRVMAAFNEPANRRFLVSGEAMGNWSSADLVSPCRDTNDQPPGNPTREARDYGDGQFRDLETLAVDAGTRQFRVTKVTYAAGLPGAADRRSQSITTTADSKSVTSVGNFSQDLINLEPDPDAATPPGFNKGHFTITVEGKVVEGDKISKATITREFEVVPRCCGASFGSNQSGGINPQDPNQSEGADSRLCGVEFGMIIGLNGGTAWQNFADDRYTRRTATGRVTNISNVIGIVSKDGDQFSRSTFRMRPNSKSTTVPDACDPARWAGGSCSGGGSWKGLRNASPGNPYGTQADIDGTAYSGVPILPSALTLPRIGSEVTTGYYNYTWTKNGGPDKRVAGSIKRYPTLNPPGASGYKFRFRTRNDTTPPRIEACNESPTSLGGEGTCTNSSWTAISGNASTENNETFEGMGSYSSSANCIQGSTNCPDWSGAWFALDDGKNDTKSGSGRTRLITSGNRYIQLGATSSSTALENAICRAANLDGKLGRAMLSFDQGGSSSVDANDEIWVQVTTNGSTSTNCTTPSSTGSSTSSQWVTIAKFPGSAKALTSPDRRVVSLADYQGATTRIRIINGTATASGEIHYIDNVNLTLSDWCEYTAISPASRSPGFHCLGPQFNLSVNTSLWSSNPAGGQIYIDTNGGPVSFYYTRTDDLRGSSFTDVNPTVDSNPILSVADGGFLRLVECSGTPSNNCTTPVPEGDTALVGDPDNLNFFGRDSGDLQIVNFGVVNTSSGLGRISGAWFYMPVGYFELKSYNCSGYDPPGTAPGITGDDSWIFNGRIWTQHFKPCGNIHVRVPPSSGSNLGAVVAATNVFSDLPPTFVPWTGTDWVARAVTQSRRY
jgi:hypothetical protein